ncbi:MAG TPA: hypothetical protein VEI82_02935, partial [Myxococcota bacterium]|nr:hypothetical protein [Myxococcota bacterium]
MLLVAPLALGIALENRLELAPLGPALLALAGLALWGVRARGRGAAAGEALLGVGLGALALSLRLAAPVPEAEPGPAAFTLLEAPLADTDSCRAAVWVHGARPGRALLLGRGALCGLLPGQSALARLALEPVRPASNPGAVDPGARLARRGIRRIARMESGAVVPIGTPPSGLAAQVERLRRVFAERLDPAAAPTRAGGLLRALTVADVSHLPDGVRRAFADSGTTHLLSVSGTH